MFLNILPLSIIFLLKLKFIFNYNSSIPFNFSQEPEICYEEDFILTNHYRTLDFNSEIFPIRGCNSDERNKLNIKLGTQGLINITFSPRLDFFFPNVNFPPVDTDPPRSMTFRFSIEMSELKKIFENSCSLYVYFGRSDDYHSVPKISKKTGKDISKDANGKNILETKFKITLLEDENDTKGLTSKDYDFYEYEGYEAKTLFDGYEMKFNLLENSNFNLNNYLTENNLSKETKLALIIRVYDTPAFKIQGYFQYKSNIQCNSDIISKIYTVDTRNVFFQNISMFYNQRVNVSKTGLDPTGEDSGFWINTPCNTPQMATIMVDYFFFDTIHRMQKFGYEFDRLQLRIHTPYYHKTLNTKYSLFRSQWNETYEKPRVFIHPISNYRDHCLEVNGCKNTFNYTDWSTNPVWTKYIIDIKNEIYYNEIRIDFSELEKIYEADGFHRSKLSINVNNTMTPHINQITNGLWAELYDPVTETWVMRTKIIMDEVDGYTDSNENDPYRNFYLTCEIPDNVTSDDMEFVIKKFGVLQTAHLWFKLDVFNKGITKLYPPRFNVVFRFPPEVYVTNDTFGYTYTYYQRGSTIEEFMYFVIKDFRETGYDDGMLTEKTFDVKRNQINVSELHPNTPNGDVPSFYTQTYNYLCYNLTQVGNKTVRTCFQLAIKRQFLYYFYDLSVAFNQNGTQPVDITVYHIKYVPYHSKNQINRGLHRWNPHQAGWEIPNDALVQKSWTTEKNRIISGNSYRYYYEAYTDNYYLKPKNDVNYWNYIGSTNEIPYDKSDCIFGLAGGSTMRNTSCSYWNGLINDKPFTNFARDIYEEHIAYKGVDDDTFRMDNSARDAEVFSCHFDVPFAAKKTSLLVKMEFSYSVPRNFDDSEYLCQDLYDPYVKGCDNDTMHNTFKFNYNIHKYTTEYFTKITLPEGITVEAQNVGLVKDCNYKRNYVQLYFNDHYGFKDFQWLVHYLCYYANATTIYAFNSTSQQGYSYFYTIHDVTINIDGLYVHENLTMIKRNTGKVEFGFFDSVLWKSTLPRDEDITIYHRKNDTKVEFKRNTFTNDVQGYAEVEVTVEDELYWDLAYIIAFDDGNDIFTYRNNLGFDGVYDETEQNTSYYWVNANPYYSMKVITWRYQGIWDNFEYSSEITNGTLHRAYIFSPYGKEYVDCFTYNLKNFRKDNRYIFEGQKKKVSMRWQFRNPRSTKPFNIYVYKTNLTLKATFQRTVLTAASIYPKIFDDIQIFTNSNFTSDRAIYTIKFNISNFSYVYAGEYFEFKTSWKSSYRSFNDSPPDEDGYYTQRFYFKQNHTKLFYWSNDYFITFDYNCSYLINPDSLEEQYIKDWKYYDVEGYLVAASNHVWPIKMERYIGFKQGNIETNTSEIDPSRFDIKINLVPEVVIQPNDTLNLKFSKGVLLSNYSECSIKVIKGMNISEPDFKCEIKNKTNEITIYNSFRTIGETDNCFNNYNLTTLSQQEILFILEAVPINRTHDNEEIYSVEVKTLTNGTIKQINNLPSTAYFQCGYKCKTCLDENINLCLTCNENFPFYDPEKKECLPHCLSNYFSFNNKETNNIECKICDENCKTCSISEKNCTSCDEPYYLENEKCVLNCSEGNAPDEKIRKCYPIVFINDTRIINNTQTIYVNVSVPYYIEKNCSVPNDTRNESDFDNNENNNTRNETDENDDGRNNTNPNDKNNTNNNTGNNDTDNNNNGTDNNNRTDNNTNNNETDNNDNMDKGNNRTDNNSINNNTDDNNQIDDNNSNYTLDENEILIHKFKFKMPFDYFIIPIAVIFILILLEILKCCCINYYVFIFFSYFIIGLAIKTNLIFTYLFAFRTGYEPFFYFIAIILIIHMYLTFTFILSNLCTKTLTLRYLIPHNYLYILSLLTTFITDYKNFEIYTRFTIEQKIEDVKIVKITDPQKGDIEKTIVVEKNNNVPPKICKYTLVQDICINKLLIILDWILVHFIYWVLAIYIFVTYKTFSFLWWCCIYGIFLFILNISFYLRFSNIEYISENLNERFNVEIENEKNNSHVSDKTDIHEHEKNPHDEKDKHILPPPLFPKNYFEISRNKEITYRGQKPENDKDKNKNEPRKSINSERKSLTEEEDKEKNNKDKNDKNKNDKEDEKNKNDKNNPNEKNININVNKNININDNRNNNNFNGNKNNNYNENKNNNNNFNDPRNNNFNDNNFGKNPYNDYQDKRNLSEPNKCLCPCHCQTGNVICICKKYDQYCPKHHRNPTSSHQLLNDDIDIIHNDNTNYNIYKNFGSPEKSENSRLNTSGSKDNVIKRKIVCKIDEVKIEKDKDLNSNSNPINYHAKNMNCRNINNRDICTCSNDEMRRGLVRSISNEREKSLNECSDVCLDNSVDMSSIIYNPSREDISYLSVEKYKKFDAHKEN